jgi:uncharacterized membrane protein YjdF
MKAVLSLCLQTCLKTAWAPVAVFIFRALAYHYGVRKPLDPAIHFAGGLAIAYVLYWAIRYGFTLLGRPSLLVRYLLAFTASCTVALFWEFGEYASDVIRDTHIQFDIHETLGDLICGVLGATVTLSLLAMTRRGREV